jgi:hypothetical protein
VGTQVPPSSPRTIHDVTAHNLSTPLALDGSSDIADAPPFVSWGGIRPTNLHLVHLGPSAAAVHAAKALVVVKIELSTHAATKIVDSMFRP